MGADSQGDVGSRVQTQTTPSDLYSIFPLALLALRVSPDNKEAALLQLHLVIVGTKRKWARKYPGIRAVQGKLWEAAPFTSPMSRPIVEALDGTGTVSNMRIAMHKMAASSHGWCCGQAKVQRIRSSYWYSDRGPTLLGHMGDHRNVKPWTFFWCIQGNDSDWHSTSGCRHVWVFATWYQRHHDGADHQGGRILQARCQRPSRCSLRCGN